MDRYSKNDMIKLLQRAVDRWGREDQINKIQEEALELSLAINQYKCPTKSKSIMIERLYDELADNAIMVGYYNLLFDPERLANIVHAKLARLETLLDRLDEADQEAQKE